MASAFGFYKAYSIKRAYAQVAGAALSLVGAATNTLTLTAHGLSDNDVIVVTAHATLTLTDLKRYYVRDATANNFKVAATPGGSAIAIGDSGTATAKKINNYELDWANKIAAPSERDTYAWAGSHQKTQIELLARLSLALDLDCIPSEAHALIFSKSTISDTLVGSMTAATAVGFGGGDDVQGVSVGMLLEGYALKGATETPISFSVWYPVGILTLSAAPGLTSGAVADKQQYLFSATRGASDVAGGTIANLSSDGEYYIIAEST